MILLDTNALIETLKNNRDIISFLEQQAPPVISSITAMELIYGANNKHETRKLNRFLDLFPILHVSEIITQQVFKLINQYAKSHSLDIPDSLIAATTHELSLYTLNKKHFRYIDNISLLHH